MALEMIYSSCPSSPSKKTFVIAGILTTVYGLDELSPKNKNVACLWLLHPRLQTQACMQPLAASAIHDWNGRLKDSNDQGQGQGLIAVSFDQRNHGSREIDATSNEAWRSGNPSHAQDMFSAYHGTAIDVSQLITYLSSYIFPDESHILSSHMVLGISLGGHCAWHCILHDPRITTAVVVIGCPDYVSLMSDRARLSKLQTWTGSSPAGASFIGSKDFPPGLVKAVEKYDPVGVFLGDISAMSHGTFDRAIAGKDQEKLRSAIRETLQRKRILNLAGGADKLVPYARGEPFMKWLKHAVGPDGWAKDCNVVLEDIVFDGVGHEMTPAMVKEAVRFIGESLNTGTVASDRPSKI